MRFLGEKAKARAVEQFRSDILQNWQATSEQPDGTIVGKDQLADPRKLFICSLEDTVEGKVNRSYGRFTDFEVPDTNDSYLAPIWKEGQAFDIYEANYNKLIAYAPKRKRTSNGEAAEADGGPVHQWGSALTISRNGDFQLLHSDVLDYCNYPTQAIALSREEDGRFLRLKFRMRDLEFKISYSSKELDENIVGLLVSEGLGFGLEAKHVYTWWDYDRVDLVFHINEGGPTFLRYKRDANGNTVHDGIQTITHEEEFRLLGRRVVIGNRSNSVSLGFYKLDDPETLDFSVEVPKRHQLETVIDHNGDDAKRFAIEDELIPDEIRRRPFQKPGDFDDMWLFADVVSMMGVKVTKNTIVSE